MGTISSIHFFNESSQYKLRNIRKRIEWLIRSIHQERKIPGSINFIFCNDEYLLQMNRQYLKHDFYTDIITFDNSNSELEVTGDVYLSIDRIRENAKKYLVKIDDELDRVLIHGVLHLMGYEDKRLKDKRLMTDKEDYYLSIR